MQHDEDDPPPTEAPDFWYYFNRWAELCAAYARARGFI